MNRAKWKYYIKPFFNHNRLLYLIIFKSWVGQNILGSDGIISFFKFLLLLHFIKKVSANFVTKSISKLCSLKRVNRKQPLERWKKCFFSLTGEYLVIWFLRAHVVMHTFTKFREILFEGNITIFHMFRDHWGPFAKHYFSNWLIARLFNLRQVNDEIRRIASFLHYFHNQIQHYINILNRLSYYILFKNFLCRFRRFSSYCTGYRNISMLIKQSHYW